MADMIPQGTQDTDQGTALGGYEKGDANIRAVIMTMTIILTSCTVVVALLIPMFGAFTAREERKDADVPALFAVRQPTPPAPRLLPLPVDDADLNLSLGLPYGKTKGAASGNKTSPMARENTAGRPRESVDYTTDNQLPWDKMLNEAAVEQAQYDNATKDAKTGRILTIPVDRAMELMAGPAKQTGGQQSGGTTPAGAHGDEANSTTGQQTGAMAAGIARDLPPYYGPVITENGAWEEEYEKYTSDSSGGYKARNREAQ